MSKSFFEIPKGLSIDTEIQYITGSGVPGLVGDSTTVKRGSLYSDFATGKYYAKHTPGSGVDRWTELADVNYVNSLVSSGSWREPARLIDTTTYANIAAVNAAIDATDMVDGVTIVSGDRVLFTDITSGNSNVYIIGGATGAWTLTEDTNAATDGDALLIQEGGGAEEQWAYDGATWVTIGSALNAIELGFIRDFIGKDGASIEMPLYTNENFIADGDSLENAIDKLDGALGPNVTTGNIINSGNTINENLQAIDADLQLNHLEASETGVTTQTTIDSVPVTGMNMVKWLVKVFDTVTSQWYGAEILAMHDGLGNADIVSYAEMRLPGSPNVFVDVFDVDVNAGNLRLLATMPNASDISSKRISVL